MSKNKLNIECAITVFTDDGADVAHHTADLSAMTHASAEALCNRLTLAVWRQLALLPQHVDDREVTQCQK